MTLEKDLRYTARRKKSITDAEAVKAAIALEIDKTNDFLKQQGIRVSLFRNSNSIQLKATLPIKEGDTSTSNKGTKQYKITHLKCFANPDGIKKAIKEAIYLDELVKHGKFDWNRYLPTLAPIAAAPLNWKDAVELFENNYWITHAKNRKTLNTWDKSYCDLFKKLDLEAKINNESIIAAIKKTEANTVTRNNLVRVLKAVCKLVDYKFDFSSYSCSTNKIQRKERKIPTDDEIVRAWATMPDEATKWVFGMVATYGLRPEEIFIKPHLQEYVDPSNTLSVFYVDRDCKTGDRKVLPLKPEWVELFNLKNLKPLITNAAKLETIISWVNKKFRRSPHWQRGAYDLRHGYAIRGHKYGIPVADMARYMGHDIETHVKEYQRWIGLDTMIEVYLEATNAKQKTKKQLVLENSELMNQCDRLKTENEQLRTLLTQYQLAEALKS